MPYDNKYNRMLADDIMKLNRKYLEHDKMTGEGLSGGFLGALAGAILPSVVGAIGKQIFGGGMSGGEGEMPAAFYEMGDAAKGDGMSGGAGFAEGTHMDTGFERTIGAGMSAGVAQYKKKGRGRPKKMVGGTELGLPESIAGEGMSGGLVPVANMKSSSMAGGAFSLLGSMLKSMPVPQTKAELKKMMKESGAGRSGAGRSGAGRSGAGRSGAGRSGAGRSGAGRSGAGRSGAGRSGAGRSGAGRSGAGVSGGASGINLMGALTGPMNNMMMELAKKVVKSKKGKGRSGAGMSGAGKNKRAAIVKQIMKEKGMSMIEASKYVKENNLYQK